MSGLGPLYFGAMLQCDVRFMAQSGDDLLFVFKCLERKADSASQPDGMPIEMDIAAQLIFDQQRYCARTKALAGRWRNLWALHFGPTDIYLFIRSQ